MKAINSGKRSAKIAAAFGAILLTTGCATSYDPQYTDLPENLDGGVGQLLRYCSKFQKSGELVTAAGLCDRAHKLEPQNPVPLMQLADILNGLNQPDQAMAAYRMIIETAPHYTDARYELGKMHIGRSEYDLAAAQFQAALRSDPEDPRFYNALGISHGMIGANESAMQAFANGLNIAPKHISLRNNMGLALVMDGNHEDGVRMLEEVVADPAANDTSHRNLQLAYGMVTAANAEAEAAAQAAEQAASGAPQKSITPVESVMAVPHSQMAAATSPTPQQNAVIDAPVPLVPERESEHAILGTGEIETPIEVTVRDETTSASPTRGSPLRVQTARANTGDTVDSNIEKANPPSADLGEYLTADAQPPAPVQVAMAPTSSEAQTAAVRPMAPATTSGDYAVQLASYLSEARAMLGWSELRGNAPDLLDPISPVVQRADLGEDIGTVYRLRTTSTAKDDATALCGELKSRGISCLVVKNAPGETESGPLAG
jgi:tetratricopeptide (TPR) repeat protein